MFLELGREVDAQALLLRPVIGEQDRVVGDAEAEVAAGDDPVEIAGPGFGQRGDQRVLSGVGHGRLGRSLSARERDGDAEGDQNAGGDQRDRPSGDHAQTFLT